MSEERISILRVGLAMNCEIYRSSSQASSVKPDDTTTDLKNEEGKHYIINILPVPSWNKNCAKV